jgi:Cu+-exporting ATPase
MFTRMLLITASVFALTVAGCGGEKTEEAAKMHETEEVVVKATDPVCGMHVDEQQALSAKHGGAKYYFCSAGCKERFEKDPHRYISH